MTIFPDYDALATQFHTAVQRGMSGTDPTRQANHRPYLLAGHAPMGTNDEAVTTIEKPRSLPARRDLRLVAAVVIR